MNTTPQFSRRTIARGIAWSAPVVVAFAVVPAYARSIEPPTVTVVACKSPGKSNPQFPKGYNVYFEVVNNADEVITINDIQVNVTGANLKFI